MFLLTVMPILLLIIKLILIIIVKIGMLVFAVRNFKQLKLLQAEFNESLKLSRLTRSMKSANIVVLFKKNDRPNKTN